MNIIASIKAHIQMIKELIALYQELKKETGEIDSISDVKKVLETVKEAIAVLKQYKSIKAEISQTAFDANADK